MIAISFLTGIGFQLTRCLDAGKTLPVEATKDQIGSRGIFRFLEAELGLDVSPLYSDDEAELIREWQGWVEGYDESTTWGIEHNGIALVLAYVLESIQNRRPQAEASDMPRDLWPFSSSPASLTE